MQPGRKSVALLSVFNPEGITSVERIQPPDDMPVEQAALWVRIVEAKTADWFDAANAPLLASYCRHTVEADYLSRRVDQMRAERNIDTREYLSLLSARERETKAASSFATRMRLTQQSHFDKKRNSTAKARKPWEQD